MVESMRFINDKPFKLLKAIGNNGPCSSAYLSKHMTDPYCWTAMYKMLKEFNKACIVNKEHHPKNKRDWYYSLNAKGTWMLELLNRMKREGEENARTK